MAGKSGNTLQRWEVAVVKAMQTRGGSNDQEILAYFTRPKRTVNHRLISEIRTEKRHKAVKAASDATLDEFLATWPDIDPQTGLSIREDELLIKAREAMIAAVHTFNGAGLNFRAELFIVTAVIAWTYLMHAYLKRAGVDYRHRHHQTTEVLKTKHGADKHWELEHCLRAQACPLDDASKANLKFLIEIRHEIEHQMTRRIDNFISAKLQACCLNFNSAIKSMFGPEYGLDRDLGVALQFTGISKTQRNQLLRETDLPQHLVAAYNAYEDALPEAVIRDQRYAYRVAYVEVSVNSRGKADQVVEFIRPDSAEGQEIARVLIKESERKKYKPKDIVAMMVAEGHAAFNMYAHKLLWQAADAKNPVHRFGVELRPGDWWWYDKWADHVRAHLAASR
jgi:SpoVK/Ycf46/Vps4 family AAA+-type ATPase